MATKKRNFWMGRMVLTSHRGARTRAVWLAAALGTLSCSDESSCTGEIRMGIHGHVLDSGGRPLVPDRVALESAGHPAFECEISEPRNGTASYSCVETHAETARVTAFVGAETVTRTVRVAMEPSGCHAKAQEVNLVLE